MEDLIAPMTRHESTDVALIPIRDVVPLFDRAMSSVREDMIDNPYIAEARRVLPVGGYRSAIGSFWNAVVDDLRSKIIFRSIDLFNKSVSLGRDVKTYEDFQNHVTDDVLLDGAYKIGVIGWEAHKVLKHAKETRHIFDGHPKSSEPSLIKVLAMIDDCTKYVLQEEYPPQIIDLDEYLANLSGEDFDRNEVGVENALGDLPETYKTQLVNRLFSSYIHPDANTILRGNIEFIVPILWGVLPKEVKVQVVRRVDQEIPKGNAAIVENAFTFIRAVKGGRYLSTFARKYKILPLVDRLSQNLDKWAVEDATVSELYPYRALIPPEVLPKYVEALTQTYVGHIGGSAQYSRTDFFANRAALYIPKMFEAFDNAAASAFIQGLRASRVLKDRIHHPRKLARLRSLGNIVLERVNETFTERALLEALVDEGTEREFFELLRA